MRTCRIYPTHRLLLLCCLLGLLTGPTFAADNSAPHYLSEALQPHPSFTPGDVVRMQLEALRRNDGDNRGIAVAFRFASPQNRAQTGPFERFVTMIKNGPYGLMLKFRQALYDKSEVVGTQARVRVLLIGEDAPVRFEFYLSKLTEAPFEDCWMTEGVGIAAPGGAVASAARVF